MGRSRVASAIGLAMLMALSTIGAPATAQEAAVDPRQPSVENPHMHVYGTSDLSNCFMHFDGNDTSGSANEGYGEKEWTSANQQVEVDYTCRMENFKQDMYLNGNGTISIHLEFEIDAADCQSDADVCENLNLTLYKGGFQVARQEFPSIDTDGNGDSVNWAIDVDRNMTRFNRSEEPQIQVQFSYPGYNGVFGDCNWVGYCGGYFRMYYHTPDNNSAEVEFPVVNQSMPGQGGEDEEGGLIGGVTDSLPGFGLMAGVGSLAMAAVAASRLSREE